MLTRAPAGGPSSRLDARDLLDALELDGGDSGGPGGDGTVDLVVAFGDPAEDDLLGRHPAAQGDEELRAADDVGAATLGGERPHDGARAVGLHGVRDDVRSVGESRMHRARLRGNGVEVVDVRGRPGMRRDGREADAPEDEVTRRVA